MEQPPKAPAKKQRRSLTKAQLETAVGVELVQLLETVTSDGKVVAAEVAELSAWLKLQDLSSLPSGQHLASVLDQVLADGVVTQDELEFLQKEVEAVLPLSLRAGAKQKRREVEAEEKARRRADAERFLVENAAAMARDAEALRLKLPIKTLDFIVRGVQYEGRSNYINSMGGRLVEASVVAALQPDNPFDSNAIALFVASQEIGYLPRERATYIAPLLASGHRYVATVKDILQGRENLAPVVVMEIYDKENPERVGSVATVVPYRNRESSPSVGSDSNEASSRGNLVLFLVVLFLIFLVLAKR